MKNLSGVFTALVTPFKNGAIDATSLKRLVEFQLDKGIEGFVVCGSTAEAACLTNAEKKNVFEIVRAEVAGQVPLVLGTGSNNTAETIEATKDAEKWGADGALVVVPYYNKPPQRGMVAHFKAVAEAVRFPVLLYNVPSRTVAKMEAATVAELSRVPNIVGIKEATGDVELGKEILKNSRDGFLLTSGDDATCFDLFEIGAGGTISVAAHILPAEFVKWSRLAKEKNSAWRTEFSRVRELIDHLFIEANPIPVKMALHMMGILDTAELRLPLVPLRDDLTVELKRKLTSAGLV